MSLLLRWLFGFETLCVADQGEPILTERLPQLGRVMDDQRDAQAGKETSRPFQILDINAQDDPVLPFFKHGLWITRQP